MRTARVRVAITILLASAASPSNANPPPNVPPTGFKALFNGRDLDGWWGMPTQGPQTWTKLQGKKLEAEQRRGMKEIWPYWTVEGNELVNSGQGYYLTSKEYFGDFELRAEVKLSPGADSGLYLRAMPQVQLWDTTSTSSGRAEDVKKGSGGLWNNRRTSPGRDPLVPADRPLGEWNSVRVTMIGERVTVELNGQLVVDHARLENYFDRSAPLPRRGPMQLQCEGGTTRWRNVFIREIRTTEAIRSLSAHGDGFQPIFNGKDFSGWAGATDDYEIRGKAMLCKPERGGTIYTQEQFEDFTVRFEFQLPAGGNNGLAIRYPGEGDAAYSGMCELQVLDNTATKYAKLDARQYHGSAYGQVAATRGFLNPVGAWNFQEVTVVGPRITVELNGTLILDADLSKPAELMYPIERFAGRERRSGHFGFAGHSDPVQFRNVSARRIR